MVLEPRGSFRESLGRVGMVQCCGLASASLLRSNRLHVSGCIALVGSGYLG